MARPTSPTINMNGVGWNQNLTWEHFASLVQATTDGIAAPNRTVRFHHIKAALYAAIGSIESFLNTTMHGHLKTQELDADAIREHVRKPTFAQKVKKYSADRGTQLADVYRFHDQIGRDGISIRERRQSGDGAQGIGGRAQFEEMRRLRDRDVRDQDRR